MSLNENNPSANRLSTQSSAAWGPPTAGAVQTSSSSQTPDAAASASAADQKKRLRTARATLLQAAIPLVLAWITAMALPFFNYEYYKWAMAVLVCAVCWAVGCMLYAAKLLKLSLKNTNESSCPAAERRAALHPVGVRRIKLCGR